MSECNASLYEIEFNSYPEIFQYTFEIFYNPNCLSPVPKDDDDEWSTVANKKRPKVKLNINKTTSSSSSSIPNKEVKLSKQDHNAFYEVCCYVLEVQFCNQIAHNGNATLYTTKELNTNDYPKIIYIDDVIADKLNIKPGSLKLLLKFTDQFDFSNSDKTLKLKSYEALEEKLYALDAILSQTARKSNIYVPCGVGKLFTTTKKDLGCGLQTHEGCMKRIYSKNINNKCSFYLAMDYVQHSFLPGGIKLSDAWTLFVNDKEIKDANITDFTKLYAGAKLQVIKDFTKVVVFQQLKQQGTDIRAQTSQGLYNSNELLIVPYQVADRQKMPNKLFKKDSTLNLLGRKDRQKKIQQQRENLNSGDDDILKQFGIKNISTEMLKCPFNILKNPKIIMSVKNHVPTELTPDDKGKIDYVTNQYILPGYADDFFIQTDGSEECIKLAKDIEERMILRGLKTTNTWTQKIESETFNQKPFALIIDRKKWPLEMNVIFEKTNNRALHIYWQEDLDIEILVTKINLILGGWCHNATFEKQLDLNDGKIFVISVDTQICHATKKQHLFVAISSNFDSKYPYKFSGCSFIQEAVYKEKASTRSPNADVLKTVVKGMLTSAQRKIEKVIFLRNEVATQYAEEEMKCIKEAVAEIFPKTKIKFAGMVVSKGGKIRHFYEHNGDVEDVPLYSMIYFDDQIFFMVSAVSSEDSIKACEINVFENKDISLDELQKFLMALTTHHQSIFPTGQPAPCMKSKEHIKNAEYAFKDSNLPSGNALKELNLKLCPFLIN